jgi:hypothetical protein
MRYESSSSSSDKSKSSSDSDSDEEDLDILKPLIPGRWPRSQGRMNRSLKDFVDIHKRDPRRPQYSVEELNQVVSFVRSQQNHFSLFTFHLPFGVTLAGQKKAKRRGTVPDTTSNPPPLTTDNDRHQQHKQQASILILLASTIRRHRVVYQGPSE